MQYQEVAGGICAPKGFAAAGVHCGIRANHSEKYDLALIKAEVRCAAAGVYTTNKVCGAPIKVDRAHLADGYAQAIVVNSGNANTCAANGVALAEECCALVGKALNIDEKDVLPASTGVIGQPMVIDPFARGIPAAAEKEMLVIGELSIHLPSLSVTLSGHKLNLTRREVELLYTLAASPGRVFTRDNLLTIVWGYEFAGNYRAVDSHIKRLRAKLDAYPHDTFTIATVWGAGYKFERNLP